MVRHTITPSLSTLNKEVKMSTTNVRVSFYLEMNDYNKLKELADTMTIERGIKTSVHNLAKSYVLKVLKN